MIGPDFDWDSAKREMEPWNWWGIQTYFRCPFNDKPGESDIAVMGVPHSSGNGSTERDQHLTPAAVRNVSALFRRSHGRFGITPWDLAKIVDAGDVPLPEGMVNDVSVQYIEAYARRFNDAGTRLVSIGGDHSVTGPLIKAVAGPHSKLTNGRPVALVHFDSHTDVYHNLPHWFGNKRSAGHWGSYTVAEGHVDPHRSTQIGIKSTFSTWGSDQPAKDLGYKVIGMDEVEEIGWKGVAAEIRKRVGDSPIYITFDMDVLDPPDAPGVANVEPGYPGLRIGDGIRILQSLRGLDIVGGDIVCMMPIKDNPNQITSMNAMVVAFEMISLMADKLGNKSKAK
ncbi:arginase family protein [Hyphomicrobium sp.]|uniref:arginase family protein n=1 Tax=Hyphomicrobium sp. TaxID=82 RepID=UPI002E36ED9F|nr:arginase family protein [Hyphomicrobium sp.]HEX2840036.1 arginase family protein [Hyphomicrobium sp.]